MAQISGVNITSTSLIAGISVTSISSIVGISTANIPGWPSAGPTCTTVSLGYSNGRKTPPEYSCVNIFNNYELDDSTGILYQQGQCGVTPAPAGYYSDGATIFFFDGFSFVPYGSCR